MKTMELKDYGQIISESRVGDAIYGAIREELKAEGTLKVDFTGVISMATYCARQVFGKLYLELGQSGFASRLSLENANDSVKSVISEAIRYSIAHNK